MALKVLSALETSKITVPAPSDTTDAATRQYVDSNSGGGGGSVSAATTDSAGIVTLASNTGTASDENKVPVLDSAGKLNSNVLPSTTVNSGMIYPHSVLYLQTMYASSAVIDCDHSVSSSYRSKNGWAIYIPSTRSPSELLFEPDMDPPDIDKCCTYEIIISCGGNTGSSFTFKIVDEDGEDVLFLGDSIVSLERGYTYFLVARYFRTLTSTNTYAWQWVFNLQGRVPIPVTS